MDGLWRPAEKMMVEHAFREAVVGSPTTVKNGIEAFLERTNVDELLVTGAIYDHAARLHSFELVSQIRSTLNSRVAARS
jgi:alkanesulfonate monooxygenase SsuD/methylene tetrahydromethanopterin reductase-like flavin-dependent oxidoreductase (luciferase family)